MVAQQTVSRPQHPPQRFTLPDLGWCIAQFCHFYPGEFKHGQISWKFFWFLYEQLPAITAIHLETGTEAVIRGKGTIDASDEGKRIIQRLRQDTQSIAMGKR